MLANHQGVMAAGPLLSPQEMGAAFPGTCWLWDVAAACHGHGQQLCESGGVGPHQVAGGTSGTVSAVPCSCPVNLGGVGTAGWGHRGCTGCDGRGNLV